MKLLRLTFFLLITALASNAIYAQAEATKWTFEAKKIKGIQYELTFHLKLKDGYHVWSGTPGGDGSLIPSSFVFDKNSSVKLVGSILEHGKLITQSIDGVEGIVHFYKNEVIFIQQAEIKKGTTVTGKYTFQVCNDMMCLAPKTEKFVFKIK